MPTVLAPSASLMPGAAKSGAAKADAMTTVSATAVSATAASATALSAQAAGAAAQKLASVKVESVHAREIAKQLEAAGRAADAKSILAALRKRGRVVFNMPIDEALKIAMAKHRDGAAAGQAETYYRAVIAAEPEHARAHHFLGVLLHNTHRTQRAMPHLLKSAAAIGDQHWVWNNLAIVYRESGELGKAEEAYLKALALKEDYPEAHNNLGVVYRFAERWDDAERRYRRALELKPDYAEALTNLGNLQIKHGHVEEGLDNLCRAIVVGPTSARSRFQLARAHQRLGQIDKAAAAYREWMELEPDNPTPRHLYAACLNEHVPDRAADTYVAQTFDRFAKTFDAKLAHLGYRAPQLVDAALAAAHADNQSYGIVADAGCGTGLCGPLVRQRAKRLIGVDLSAGMLAKARERGGYDELCESELTAFLLRKKNAYNVIISADTLCYFGVLNDVVKAAHDALKPNGVLVFTVEALPDDSAAPHLLQVHGRYAHRRSYIEEALRDAGFTIEAMRQDDLRMEDARPVKGWLATARRS